MTLAPSLAFGVDDTEVSTAIARTDGKPLNLVKLEASKPWITAKAEPEAGKDGSAARIRITVRRDGAPRRMNEHIQIYTADQTNGPVSTIYLYGQILGQVSVSPDSLYWSVTGVSPAPAGRPESAVMRLVTIRSMDGKPIALKNVQTTIKGIDVELVPKEPGKVYELVAKLDENPAQTVSGNISFETSVAAQAKIEIPVIVNVFKQ
jgi:hypothetical protein